MNQKVNQQDSREVALNDLVEQIIELIYNQPEDGGVAFQEATLGFDPNTGEALLTIKLEAE